MAVATSVVGGLLASIAAAVFLIEPPKGDLPGIALKSETILMVERAAMLFACWLLALVAIARALAGQPRRYAVKDGDGDGH